MKFNKQRKQIILEAIGEGLPKRTAAALASITEKTLYEWIAKGKEQEPPAGLEEMAVKDLRARAKKHEIKGYTKLPKEKLIEAITRAETEYRGFYLDLQRAEAEGIREHMRNIKRAARDDWKASGWYLERIAPQDFGRRDALKVENQHSGTIQTEHTESYKIEQIQRFEADPELQRLYMQIWEREQIGSSSKE